MTASAVCAKCYSVVLLISAVIVKVDNFCYNQPASVIFEPIDGNASNNSYFGYSVSLRAGPKPLVVIGAPRASSLYLSHVGIQNPGAVYFCYLPNQQNGNKTISCPQRILDTNGNTRHPLSGGKSYHHKKDDMWLGMAIDGTDNSNGTLAMCAPRWINQYHPEFYLANGLCYSVPNTEPTSSNTALLIPLVDQYNQGFVVTNADLQPSYGENTYFYAYGEAGMSVRLTSDGKELLIGAPGVYIWTGTVIKYKIVKQTNGPDYFIKANVPNPFYTFDMKDASYFGYSVDSGKFLSDVELLYVAGAPRAAYKGKVYVFDFPLRENGRYIIHVTLEGDQMGSYFGSSICAVDLNADGLTDLIIGAPLYVFKEHTDSSGLPYDQGRAYVYMNGDKAKFTLQEEVPIAGRTQNGARFGSTISSLGDINDDGFNDVAIGAPYEEFGAGAVYIYLGTQAGLNPTYSQRIFFRESKGFGISISRGVDIDSNSCNDVAIGSFLSSRAYLLKCHPTIKVVASISTADSKELPSNTTEFTANFCLKISSRTRYSPRIQIKVSIDPVYRRATLFGGENIYVVDGRTNSVQCSEKKITIEPTNKDFSRPIDLVMEYDLVHDPTQDEKFCADCPVLSPDAVKKVTLKVPLASGCGLDMVCQPDLVLDVKVLNTLPYVIGSTPSIKLNVSVENVGEPAFLATISVALPPKTPLARLPPSCHIATSEPSETLLLLCDLDNPLLKSVKRHVVVEIDTKSLQSSDKSLEINITATSVGEEVTPSNNAVNLKLQLKASANVEVFGESVPSQYIYFYMDDETSLASNKVNHNFEVVNHGPTTMNSIIMRFYIPVSIVTKDHNLTIFNVMEPKTNLNMQGVKCRTLIGELYEEKEEGHSVDVDNNSNETTRQRRDTNTSNASADDLKKLHLYNSDTKVELPALDSGGDAAELSGAAYVNCSSDSLEVRCLVVECEGGPLASSTNGARISFPMRAQPKNIATLFSGHTSVVVTTHVIVEPKDERIWRATTELSSVFVLQASMQSSVPPWLIAISLICGILLLLAISWALYKFGFFHRKTKEDLELLKNQEQGNMELIEDNGDED